MEIPPRYNVDIDGPLPGVRLFLDDIEQHHVIAYDIDVGMVERAQLDDNEQFVRKEDEFATETVYGVVRVEPC